MVFDRMTKDQSSWPRVRIGDVAQVYDGPHATPTKTATGPIFLGISALNRGRLDLANTEHLSEEDFSKWTRRVVPSASDVVFSYETRIGEAAIIPKGLRCCLGRRMGLVRVDASRLDPHFFLYQYLSPTFQGFLHSRTIHGSTVDRIALKDFPDFEIDLPPLTVQRQIAKVMLDLDAKIDLNRRINQTLEATAQAIFKSWFVDFDPVKAKIAAVEQGEDPLRAAMRAISGKTDAELDQMPREHHDQLVATAALFSDAMEESELGEIPKGWRVNTLSDVTDYLNRGISPKYLEDGGVLVLNQKCIRDFRVDESKGRRHDPNQRKIDGRTLKLGDVLVNSTGVGTLGRVAQVLHLSEPTIVDSHVTVVRAGCEINDSYLGCYISWKQPDIEAMGEGSTGQTELSRLKLAELSMLTPHKDVLKAFDALILPLKAQISAKERESAKLAELRDTLLPKLLSGELSMIETKEQVTP